MDQLINRKFRRDSVGEFRRTLDVRADAFLFLGLESCQTLQCLRRFWKQFGRALDKSWQRIGRFLEELVGSFVWALRESQIGQNRPSRHLKGSESEAKKSGMRVLGGV